MREIKDCPFCGGKAELTEKQPRYGSTDITQYVVRCKGAKCCCGKYSTRYFDTADEAIDMWNMRAPT